MTAPINQFRELSERRRETRAQERAAVLRCFERHGGALEMYSVEVAVALGLEARADARGRATLSLLEQEGALTSRWEPARSGPGRRYYRLARGADETSSA